MFTYFTSNGGIFSLSFVFDQQNTGLFALDNVELIDITGLEFQLDLASLQNTPIFVPSVHTFNDYYPFGMLMPGRYESSDSYRYGFQSLSRFLSGVKKWTMR